MNNNGKKVHVLCHVTQVANLESIHANGLLAYNDLTAKKLPFASPGELGEHPNFVELYADLPDFDQFAHLRTLTHTKASQWALVVVKSKDVGLADVQAVPGSTILVPHVIVPDAIHSFVFFDEESKVEFWEADTKLKMRERVNPQLFLSKAAYQQWFEKNYHLGMDDDDLLAMYSPFDD